MFLTILNKNTLAQEGTLQNTFTSFFRIILSVTINLAVVVPCHERDIKFLGYILVIMVHVL